MFGHYVVSDNERRLDYKYFLRLKHKFLAYKEVDSRQSELTVTVSNNTEISPASDAAIRYLAGMFRKGSLQAMRYCFAQHPQHEC